mmetsp:Transcript_9143/g.22445  ORF Transcript_9143/g.22445 Transcript_9143/m.22445 type:complete len:236 (-) Transcript_9143:1838-2545(-)
MFACRIAAEPAAAPIAAAGPSRSQWRRDRGQSFGKHRARRRGHHDPFGRPGKRPARLPGLLRLLFGVLRGGRGGRGRRDDRRLLRGAVQGEGLHPDGGREGRDLPLLQRRERVHPRLAQPRRGGRVQPAVHGRRRAALRWRRDRVHFCPHRPNDRIGAEEIPPCHGGRHARQREDRPQTPKRRQRAAHLHRRSGGDWRRIDRRAVPERRRSARRKRCHEWRCDDKGREHTVPHEH